MKDRFTLTLYRDDMGSFKQPGCVSREDALWHINSARDHDGLPHIGMDDLNDMLKWGDAKLTPEN